MAIVLPKLSRIRTSARTVADAPPALTVELCREDGQYEAGKPLAAHWRIGETTIDQVTGLEASVLWYTEGKGDEDLHVHHFERWNESQLRTLDLAVAHAIDCTLPLSPVSYEGTLLRIRWCARVRLFRSTRRECVAQQPFQLVAAYGAVVGGPDIVASTLVL